jgi:hypothetical protein
MARHDAFMTFLHHLEPEGQCSPKTIVAYRGTGPSNWSGPAA